MTQQITQKDSSLAYDTFNGLYDTDGGGKRPTVREAIRLDLEGLVRLAKMTAEEWDLLPLHDLVVIQRMSGVLVANAAELTIVRIQQNQNETAFRVPRPKGRPVRDEPQA